LTFRLIYEVDPPREATLTKFFRQLEIFGDVVDTVLIPDNHLGRSALSSVVLAIEAAKRGFRPIVALNARDRNHLRLHSDFLTLRAFGIDEVLLLFGDRIDSGRSDLTVRRMLEHEGGDGLRRGVVAPLTKPLAWRRAADFVFTQLGSAGLASVAALRQQDWSKPVYGGTAALPTREMAAKVLASIPGFTVPEGYLEAFDDDPEWGFRFALDYLDGLCDGGCDGAHLVVPAGRLRFAEMLGDWVAARRRADRAAVIECPT
jgi:methylenetetrahydrofolate reductase (NADPH)